MVKYYARLLKQNCGSLLYEAYISLYKESLLLSNDNKDSWLNLMKHLLGTYVDEHILNTFYSDPSNSVILVKHIKYKMYSSFEKLWLESMSVNKSDPKRQSKLRTYSKFNNKLIFEPYLEKIKNINKRTCFTRFRISAHELKIERQIFFTNNTSHRKIL